MKLLLGLLVSLAISSAFGTPVRSPKDEVDIVELPRGPQRSRESNNNAGANDEDTDVDPDFKDFKGVVDTGAGYPFLAPLPHPFSFNLGFFDSFEDIFRRLRTRLWSLGSEETSEEGTFTLGSNPAKGGNTTSVVKVVDGHKIEINDTVYGNGDGKNGAVFKFRVINIRPLESGEDVPDSATEGTTLQTKTRDIEGKSDEKKDSSEESKPYDNEISANIDDPELKTHTPSVNIVSTTKEAITTEMQDIDQISSLHEVKSMNLYPIEVNDDDASTEVVETFEDDVATPDEDNESVASDTIRSEQLSMPTEPANYNPVNDNEGAIENLDASELQNAEMPLDEAVERLALEQIRVEGALQKLLFSRNRENLTSSSDEDEEEDADDSSYQGLNSEWGSLNDKNTMTNEIDAYESVPIDLSNDIAVNEMLADQGAPVNPDAEVFDVGELIAANNANHGGPGRRFEVLSDMK